MEAMLNSRSCDVTTTKNLWRHYLNSSCAFQPMIWPGKPTKKKVDKYRYTSVQYNSDSTILTERTMAQETIWLVNIEHNSKLISYA